MRDALALKSSMQEAMVDYRPCIKCGATDRYTSGACIPCQHTGNAAYRAANKETIKARNATYRICNPEKVKARNAAWLKANPEKMKVLTAAWRKANPAKKCVLQAKRRSAKLNATPRWANEFFIEEIYDLAQRRTKATVFEWHVDHTVPLQSKLVCGLHVEHNLAVIPATENLKKHNFHWPNMPD